MRGIWATSKRDEFGVIVTVRLHPTGELRSLHEPGLRIEALRAIADKLDRAAGDWKIVCYSTPQTILGDMKGLRSVNDPKRPAIGAVESVALGKIDRLDLLDPSIPMHDKRNHRKKRR